MNRVYSSYKRVINHFRIHFNTIQNDYNIIYTLYYKTYTFNCHLPQYYFSSFDCYLLLYMLPFNIAISHVLAEKKYHKNRQGCALSFKKAIVSAVFILEETYKNILLQICEHIYPSFENSIHFELVSKLSDFIGIRCTI